MPAAGAEKGNSGWRKQWEKKTQQCENFWRLGGPEGTQGGQYLEERLWIRSGWEAWPSWCSRWRVHSVKTLKSQTSMEIQLGSLTSCVPSLLPLVMRGAGWETPWQNDGKVRFSKKHLSQTSLESHTLSRAHTHYLMLQSCSQMGNICCSVMGNNTFCNSGGSAPLFKEAQFSSLLPQKLSSFRS